MHDMLLVISFFGLQRRR